MLLIALVPPQLGWRQVGRAAGEVTRQAAGG